MQDLSHAPHPGNGRRTYVKRSTKQSVDLRFTVLRGNSKLARGRCTSMNESGFGAVIAGELPIGETLAVEFVLVPSNLPIRLMASVRTRQGFVHRFDFIAPNDAQRQMIAEFWSEQLGSAS